MCKLIRVEKDENKTVGFFDSEGEEVKVNFPENYYDTLKIQVGTKFSYEYLDGYLD